MIRLPKTEEFCPYCGTRVRHWAKIPTHYGGTNIWAECMVCGETFQGFECLRIPVCSMVLDVVLKKEEGEEADRR